jgi:hypothetical protein
MKRKEHLTLEGIKKIVALKSVLNNGLSDELKSKFSTVVAAQRPLVKNQLVLDPD